jgi:hypothetical protein
MDLWGPFQTQTTAMCLGGTLWGSGDYITISTCNMLLTDTALGKTLHIFPINNPYLEHETNVSIVPKYT